MSPQSASSSALHAAELRHSFRTPLNHVIGYAEILLEDASTPDFSGLLHAIIDQARQTLDCLQSLLPGNDVELKPGLFAKLTAQASPHLDAIEDSLRSAETLATSGSRADLEKIGIATRKLRKGLTGSIVSTSPATASGSHEVMVPAQSALAIGSILVVDDNELNRDMLCRQVERQHHRVDTANHGAAALEMLRSRRYDLMLLDVMMPGMDGFEVLETVKRDPALRGVAVIVISALDELDSAIRCIELGAEDYLFKPVNPTLLRARIRSTLDRIRAEEALRRRQRFESIGLLAAGIAHDFNNLLTGIIGNAHLLSEVLSEPGDRDMASSIVSAGERAAELTRQLLAYSGKGMFQVQPLDLPALVRDTERLIRATLPKRSELRLALNPVPQVIGDANQMRQALLNLAINAAEALRVNEQAEGIHCISIETGMAHISSSERFDVAPEEIAPGEYAYVEVKDTGCGMEAGAVSQIFEPFYSTKFLGRGLGLAAVAGILRTHNGMLRVETAPGQGSAFRFYLPVVPVEVSGEPGTDRVLVVDDELVVRQIVKIALERAGKSVLVAESGEAAIKLLEKHADQVSLAVLDWRMPEMDGEEALARLLAIKPELNVIISTGVARQEAEARFRSFGVAGFLQKPYRMTELLSLVERIQERES